ncbi:MAG: hypothetical protein ABW206_10735, partial [Agrobacterium vaccinii]
MLQGILWLFDDPFSDLLLAGIFVLAAVHHRQMSRMHQRTNQLAFQVSELKMLIMTMPGGAPSVADGPSVTQRGPSMRFDETTLATAPNAKTHQRVSQPIDGGPTRTGSRSTSAAFKKSGSFSRSSALRSRITRFAFAQIALVVRSGLTGIAFEGLVSRA